MAAPSHLLSPADLSRLSPGDLVQHADGDWYKVEKVYPATTAALGFAVFPFFARKIDAPNVSWSDALVGPSQVASDPSQWNGTPRERVQFAPAPALQPELPAIVPAAVLATLPLPVSFRASVLLASWEEAARLDRRTAAAGPENEQAWRWHASAMEQCARELRGALEHAEA